jgi:PPOX class probable F420-dependent enzyme
MSTTMHSAYRTRSGLSDWARHILALPLDAVLGTINPDGTPHTTAVGFAFDGERFLIASGSATRKVRNLEADPRVRVLVMAPMASTGVDDGWVAADGHAELVRGEQAQALNRRAVAPYLTEEGQRGYGEVFLPIMDVAIVVTPERWHTWHDKAMLTTMIEHGYTEDDADRWYVERP